MFEVLEARLNQKSIMVVGRRVGPGVVRSWKGLWTAADMAS